MNSSKRQSSPPPPPLKRAKTEAPQTLPLTAPHGVDRIPFPPSLNPNRVSPHHLSHLITQRTDLLRSQGRLLVGLPVVLNDGIVLNWIRDHPGPAVHLHETDDSQSAACLAARTDEKPCSLLVSTGGGTGTSAADAIVVTSDDEGLRPISGTNATDTVSQDNSGVSSLSAADVPRELPINRGTSSDKNVLNFSDSDIELLSSVHPKNKVVDDPEDSLRFSLLPPVDDLPSGCTVTRDENVVALSGFCSDSTDAATSDSEDDTTGKEFHDAGDVDSSRIPPVQATPPFQPSLQSIRELLARGKPRGGPERDSLPQRTIAPGASKKQGRKRFLEEAPANTSSESEEEVDWSASDPQLKRVPLPKTKHGRARRLLIPESADLPFVAVTMRGDCHFIERKQKFRISGYSLPNPGVFRHVGDVCMVGNTAVLGCDKGLHQISFLSVAGRPHMIDVTWSPHSSGLRYQGMEKRGVSRLAAVHAEDGHIKFLSGGYDGTIHEWMAGIETLNDARSRKVVSHGASIMALAYRGRDRSVMASAQSRLHITDLNRCKTMTHLFSNDIQQIHIHPQAAYVTLLEVRHLNRQIQLYDSRKGDFDIEPCLSFGHPKANFSSTHTRGSVHLVHFAMASEDEGVLLWDFRNSKRAVIERRFRQAEKVVHTVFADSDIATFGQSAVTFFEDYLAQ